MLTSVTEGIGLIEASPSPVVLAVSLCVAFLLRYAGGIRWSMHQKVSANKAPDCSEYFPEAVSQPYTLFWGREMGKSTHLLFNLSSMLRKNPQVKIPQGIWEFMA